MSKNTKQLRSFERHLENPFVEEAIEHIKVKKRTQMINAQSKNAIHYVVNSETGEVDGYSAFLKVIEVDEERFAKLYLAELGLLWELSKPAIRIFTYITTLLKPHSDRFIFTFDDCQEYTGYKSHNSITKGLVELIEKGIIARTKYHFEYFINPMIVFNGSRVTFAKTYVKRRKKKQIEDKNQMRLFEASNHESIKLIEQRENQKE